MSCPDYVINDSLKEIPNLPFYQLYYYEKHGDFDAFEFILTTFCTKFNHDSEKIKKEYKYQKYCYISNKSNKKQICIGVLLCIGIGYSIYKFKSTLKNFNDFHYNLL
jgi:hypothetical protein